MGTKSKGPYWFSCRFVLTLHLFQLVTIRKTTKERYPPPTFEPVIREADEEVHIPAHKDFREKYFQGFKPKADETTV